MTEPVSVQGLPLLQRRVLLVEDNEAACRGLAKLLEAHGYEVETVQDGSSALEALAAGPPPDYLLTDMSLPDLDGREVARQARQLVPAPWVVLITGWDLNPDPDERATWGVDRVLSKPVDFKELLTVLHDEPQRRPPPRP
jgi:CheY-like chemotaxis protein